MNDGPQDRRKEDRRIASLETRMDGLEAGLKSNTEMTEAVHKNTQGLVEAWTAIGGGLRVLGWLGSVAKWVGVIAGMVGALSGAWYAVTHWGQSPASPIDLPK